MLRLCGPDSAQWPNFSSTQVVLKTRFSVLYLAPELVRTEHAALFLHLHIKYNRRVKVEVIKESCWKSTCVGWIILLAMLYLSLSHFGIIPFHCIENMSCSCSQCLNVGHTEHLLAWCLTEQNWTISVKQHPEIESKQVSQYVPFAARLLGILFYCYESVYLLMTWWFYSFPLEARRLSVSQI